MENFKALFVGISSLLLVACSDVPSPSEVEEMMVDGLYKESGGLFAFEDIEVGDINESDDGEYVTTNVSYKLVLAASDRDIAKLKKHENRDVRTAAQMFAITNTFGQVEKGDVIDTVKDEEITIVKNDDGEWEIR